MKTQNHRITSSKRSKLNTSIALLAMFLTCIGWTNMVIAQTAFLLPNAKQQYVDNLGIPLAAGSIDYFVPGTNTRKTTWTDSNQATPSTNPVILDAFGRPQPNGQTFGSGQYRQVVKDSNGITIWDAVTNASGGGGGGGGSVGDGQLPGAIQAWSGSVVPPNWALAYGQTFSRTTYSQLFANITIQQNAICVASNPTLSGLSDTTQIPVGAKVEASCLPPGLTVLSKTVATVTLSGNATSSGSASTRFFPWGNGDGALTFNVPDLRGRVIFGNNGMGGVSSTTLSQAYYGTDPNALGALGGSQTSTLIPGNLPPYTPAGTITNGAITSTFTRTPAQVALNPSVGGGQDFNSGPFGSQAVSGTVNSVQAASTFTGTAQGGTSAPFANVPPGVTFNYIVKVLPDTSTSIATGVASIGGMTGVINCGTGLVCSANTISVSGSSSLPIINDGQILANTSGSPNAPIGTDASTWFNKAYCDTIGYLIVRATGSWTCSNSIEIDPRWYGAVCNANTDDSVAFNNALTAAQNARTGVRFSGSCKINSPISITSGVSFCGYLMTDTTGSGTNGSVLLVDPAINAINVTSTTSVKICDMTIRYVSATASTTAMTFAALTAGALRSNILVQNVQVDTSFTCLRLNADLLYKVDNLLCNQYTSAGIIINNYSNCDAGDGDIINSKMITSTSSTRGIIVSCGGGIRITSNKILGSQVDGILISWTAGAPSLNGSQLTVNGNSIELSGASSSGIHLVRNSGTGQFVNVNINSNEIYSTVGLNIGDATSTGTFVSNVNFTGNLFGAIQNASVMTSLQGTTNAIVSGNNAQNQGFTGSFLSINNANVSNSHFGPNGKSGGAAWSASSLGTDPTNTVASCTFVVGGGAATCY